MFSGYPILHDIHFIYWERSAGKPETLSWKDVFLQPKESPHPQNYHIAFQQEWSSLSVQAFFFFHFELHLSPSLTQFLGKHHSPSMPLNVICLDSVCDTMSFSACLFTLFIHHSGSAMLS